MQVGLLVPRVLLLPGENPVGLLETPEGPRPFTLSGFVEGTKPEPPFGAELYVAFGAEPAAFHDAADNYLAAVGPRAASPAPRVGRR